MSAPEQGRILREAAARLSLARFEEERDVCYLAPLADAFVSGYLDGEAGAALERAAAHRGLSGGAGQQLAAFS